MPYLKDIINDIKKFDTWKIQLTIAINFNSQGTYEERLNHSNIDSIKIMIYDEADEVIQGPFEALFKRYQFWIETSIKGIFLSLVVLICCIAIATE